MAYATIAQVAQAAGGREKLRQLTDFEGTKELDEALVTQKVADADSMINGYVEKRYAVPVSPADLAAGAQILSSYSAKIAVFFLREDREALTTQQDERQSDRLLFLRGISDGSISLGIDPRPAASDHVRPETGDRSASARTLTRDRFRGFT